MKNFIRILSRFCFIAIVILLINGSMQAVQSHSGEDDSDTLGKMSINGQAAINFVHRGSDRSDTHTLNGANFEEILLHVEGPVSDDVYLLSEFEIIPGAGGSDGGHHNQTFAVDRAFLRSEDWIGGHRTKAGIFYLFDGLIQRYHHSHANPLPGEIVFFKNPWAHHDTIHDILSDVGVKLSAKRGGFRYSVALFNGMGDRTPQSTAFGNASMDGYYGNLRYQFGQQDGSYFGVSYYAAAATTDSDPVAPESNLIGDKDEYFIGELAYTTPYFSLNGLWLQGTQTRQIASGAKDNKGDGYVVEGVFDLTRSLATVARYQTITVDDRDDMSFFGVGAHHGIGDVEQVEAGLNYRLSRNTRLKGSWQVNEESGENTEADRGYLQLTASF